jgi:hypothetical protein
MSADLLRRAAKRLRGYGGMLPGALADRPWRVVQSDGENMDAVAACSDEVHADPENASRACDACWDMVTPHWQAARYIALMHPPVALALADWLEDEAFICERERAVHLFANKVARAILREEAS